MDAHEEGLQPADGYRPATARGRGRGPGRLRKPRARRAAWRRSRKPRAAQRHCATTDTHACPMTTLAVEPPTTTTLALGSDAHATAHLQSTRDALPPPVVRQRAFSDQSIVDTWSDNASTGPAELAALLESDSKSNAYTAKYVAEALFWTFWNTRDAELAAPLRKWVHRYLDEITKLADPGTLPPINARRGALDGGA